MKRGRPLSLDKLLLLSAFAASGCAPPYVPPKLPREQIAMVSGVERIDGRAVAGTSSTPVLPGAHVLGFGDEFGNWSLSASLLLRAGQQYAFSSEIFWMGSILKMQNLTTGRVTRLDTYHMVFYDESGTPLPADNPFAP